jgi:hypothetical protein
MRRATRGAILALFVLFGPMQASSDEARKSALIRELFVAMGLAEGLAPMMEKMVGPMADHVARLNPGRPEVAEIARRTMTEHLIPTMRRYEPEFAKGVEALYARHFDAEDIEAMLEFYRSPAGRKLVAAQVEMASEIALFSMTISQRAVRDAMPGIVEDLRKRGLKTEA